MDNLFYLYSVVQGEFLMQKNLGYTDRLDLAGTFMYEESVRILKEVNHDGEDIIAINIIQPSRKPDVLDNNLNLRVFVYQVRKLLSINGLDAKSTSFDEITKAFKKDVSVQAFVQEKRRFDDALENINDALFRCGVY